MTAMTYSPVAQMLKQMLSNRDGVAGEPLLRTALRYATEHNAADICLLVASHANAPADVLAALVAHGNPPPIQCQVLCNPSAPVDACVEAVSRTKSPTLLGVGLESAEPQVAAAAVRRLSKMPTKQLSNLLSRALGNDTCAGELETLLALTVLHSHGNGPRIAQLVKLAEWDHATWVANTGALTSKTTSDAAVRLVGHWTTTGADDALVAQALPLLLDEHATTASAPDGQQHAEKRWTSALVDLVLANPAMAPYVHAQVRSRAHLPGQDPTVWARLRKEAGLHVDAVGADQAHTRSLPNLSAVQAQSIAAGEAVSAELLVAALAASGKGTDAGVEPSWWWPLVHRIASDSDARALLLAHGADIPDIAFAAAFANLRQYRDLFLRLPQAGQRRIALQLLNHGHLMPPDPALPVYVWDVAIEPNDVLATPLPHLVNLLPGSTKLRDMLTVTLEPVLVDPQQRAVFLAVADTFEGTVGDLVNALAGATCAVSS